MTKKKASRKSKGRAKTQNQVQPAGKIRNDVVSGRSARLAIPGLFLVLAIALLVLVQGGYYAGVVSMCGLVLSLVSVAFQIAGRRQRRHMQLVPALFCLLACLYAVSSVFNGLTLTTISATAFWFAVAGAALLCAQVDELGKEAAIRWLCWFGVASAAFGYLAFTQVFLLDGALSGGRLQFTFQYANAAGIWFAVIAVLCASSGDERLRSAALLPLSALLLTQSIGAISLFAAACVALALWWRSAGDDGRLAMATVQVGVAFVLFAGMRLISGPVGLVWLAVCLGACYALWRYRREFDRLGFRRLAACALVAFGLGAAALAFLQADRLVEASQTFVERFIQVMDAAGLLGASPILGIGPDTWRYAYPYTQTAQYTASVVHCGYAQIALDAGLAGLAVFAGAAILGLKDLVKRRQVPALIAAALVLAHALVDFDLRFGALAFLLVFLLIDDSGPEIPRVPAVVAGVALDAMVVVACTAGLWAEGVRGRLDAAAVAGDAEVAEQMLAEGAAVQGDVAAVTSCLEAFARAGEWDPIAALYCQMGASSSEQAILVAQSLFECGDAEEAAAVLIGELKRGPYQVVLFEQVEILFDEYGVSDAAKVSYREALDDANALAETGRAAWLGNQETMSSRLV